MSHPEDETINDLYTNAAQTTLGRALSDLMDNAEIASNGPLFLTQAQAEHFDITDITLVEEGTTVNLINPTEGEEW